MHKSLKVNRRRLTNCTHLLDGSLSCEDDTLETNLFHELYTLNRRIVTLRARMQFNRWQITFQKTQILNDKGINADIIKPVYHLHSGFHLIVEQYSVYGSENLGPIQMSIPHKLLHILYCICCCSASAKGWCANI